MEIAYELTVDDLVEFQLYHAAHSPLIRKRLKISRFLGPTVLLVLAGCFLADADIALGGGVLAAAIVIFILMPRITRARYRTYYEKHYRENFDASGIGLNTHRIDDDGLHTGNESVSGVLKFDAILAIKHDDRQGMIRYKPGQTLVVPFRELGEETVMAYLQELSRRTGLEIQDQRGWKWP